MNSSPETLARALLSYYASNENVNPISAHMVHAEQDNEYLAEILITIYLECYKIYTSGRMGPDISQSKYTGCLSSVFISLGFVLETEIVRRDQLDSIIHYAVIKNNNVLLNPYHPFRIRDSIIDISENVPTSFDEFYNNRDMINNVITIHDVNPADSSVMILKFRQVNVHYRNNDA